MGNFEKDELIYKGRVLEVHKVSVRTPDGQLTERDLIHYNGAVVMVPVLDDGRIVLIRNQRYAVGQTLWELAAGALDAGEEPAQAAARELEEETGYAAKRLEKLGQFFSAPGTTDEVMHAYLATGLTSGPQRLEGYEDITVEVLTAAAVRGMIASGEICDAKTIAGLALYWLKKAPLT